MKHRHLQERKRKKLIRKLAGAGIFVAALVVTMLIFKALDLGQVQPSQAAGNLTGFSGQTSVSGNQPFVPGRVLLRVKDSFRGQTSGGDIQIPDLRAALDRFGAHQFRQLYPNSRPTGDTHNSLGQRFEDLSLIFEIMIDPNAEMREVLAELNQIPSVQYAEPRYLYDVFYTPDDQKLAQQNYPGPVRAFQAWDIEKGDSAVVIGIIDTGTSLTHPDLKDKLALNYADPIDGIDNDGDGYTDNYQGWDFAGANFTSGADNDPSFAGNGGSVDHGVLVAGPAAAHTDNGIGIAGIGFNTRYVPLKAAIDGNTGISHGFDAIVYAADHGIPILNLSWGYSGFSQYGEDICRYAAINKGCLLVAAAGNTPEDILVYPASYDMVMSVGGTQRGYNSSGVLEDDHVWESNSAFGTSFNFLIDVMAPSRNIRTTASYSSYYGGATGTSLAAPIVAGGVALVKAHFPTYTNRQCGELIRVTADNIYPLNSSSKYVDRLGMGRINIENALTVTTPAVRIDSLIFTDEGNGLPQPLDTVNIFPRLINYLAPTQNLVVSLDVTHAPFLEVIDGSINAGSLGTLVAFSPTTPIRVVIKRDCPTDISQWLKFEFLDAGQNYQDFQFKEMKVDADWVDVDHNNIITSLTGDGRIGFVDYPLHQKGMGLGFRGFGNALGVAGFMMATSSSKVSDGLRDEMHQPSLDLVPLTTISESTTDPRAAQVTHHEYDDSGAPNPLGIKVRRESFAWTSSGREDFIILEYTLVNEGNGPQNGFHPGLLLSWDPNTDFLVNKTSYDAATQTLYAEFDGLNAHVGKQFMMGMALISTQTAAPYNETLASFSFSETDKYKALTSTNPFSSRNGYVAQTLSAGSFNIPAGDSIVIAYAIVAGTNEADLLGNSSIAYDVYHCELNNSLADLDLGGDQFLCEATPVTLDAYDPEARTYVWSDGSTSPTLEVSQSGVYSVQIFNEFGCSRSDTVKVNFLSGPANIVLNKSLIEVGSSVDFSSDAPSSTLTWTWDFGDGSPLNYEPEPSHTYQEPGEYTITLITANGYCIDTVSYVLVVKDKVTGLGMEAEVGINLFPNPVLGPVTLEINGLSVGDVIVELQDLHGRSLVSRTFRALGSTLREQIDLSKLPSGTYLARIRTNGQDLVKKLIKR